MIDFSSISAQQAAISIGLALLPVLVWLNFMFKKDRKTQFTLLKVFLFGTFSVVPLMVIQYIWVLHPEFDVYTILQSSFHNVNLGFLALFIAVGIFEEVAKFSMLRHLKWAKVRIKTISDAMRYIFVIALGFAFTENIFYFYSTLSTGNFGSLFSVFVFRSTFTAAGHMIFSGIVGYYYAIGKFGNPVLELERWTGKQHKIVEWVHEKFGWGTNIFRLQKTMKGLLIAMGMHAVFNFTLQLNRIDYAAAIIIAGFIMVIYLSKQRMNYLVFTETEKARPSSIGKKEENVVIELMGMWLNEGKYKEVIEICERLGKRDPDNLVVKLFRAKATDRKKIERVQRAIHLLFSEEEYDVEQEEMSVFERMKRKQEKEQMLKKGHTPSEEASEMEAVKQEVKHELVKKALDETAKAEEEKEEEPEKVAR